MAKKETKKVPTPFQDRIIISKKNPESKTAGGIIIPETIIQKENEGTVVAVGPMVGKNSTSDILPKVGDKVVFGEYAGMPITFENEDYLVVKEADVLAKI